MRELNIIYLIVNKSNVTTIKSSKEDSVRLYKTESFLEAFFLLSVINHHKKCHKDYERVVYFIKKSKRLHNKVRQSTVR